MCCSPLVEVVVCVPAPVSDAFFCLLGTVIILLYCGGCPFSLLLIVVFGVCESGFGACLNPLWNSISVLPMFILSHPAEGLSALHYVLFCLV